MVVRSWSLYLRYTHTHTKGQKNQRSKKQQKKIFFFKAHLNLVNPWVKFCISTIHWLSKWHFNIQCFIFILSILQAKVKQKSMNPILYLLRIKLNLCLCQSRTQCMVWKWTLLVARLIRFFFLSFKPSILKPSYSASNNPPTVTSQRFKRRYAIIDTIDAESWT